MKYWIAISALLCGCASEAVIDMGAGNHAATGSSIRGFQAARVNAVESATEYCSKSDMKPVIQSFQDGFEAEYLSSVIFSCRAP